MNIKNINVFEQHIEKIVVAVAALGAAYLGYLAMQPITVPEHDDVRADNVEDRIRAKLEEMKAAQNTLWQQLDPGSSTAFKPIVPPYQDEFAQVIKGGENRWIVGNFPRVVPLNVAVRKGAGVIESQLNYAVVTPDPVPPLLPQPALEVFRGTVTMLQQGAGGVAVPAAPGTLLPQRDQNAVRVQGYIPLGRLMLAMADPRLKDIEKLPAADQKALIYRIDVQRQMRGPDGQWSPTWADVPPAKSSPAPTDVPWKDVPVDQIPAALTTVDTEFKLIVMPDFYGDENGLPLQATIVSRQPPAEIDREAKDLQTKIEQAARGGALLRPTAGAGIPSGGAPNWGMGTPGVPGYAAASGAGVPGYAGAGSGAAVPGAAAAGMVSVDSLKNLTMIPFCFWDETVQPDREYSYRVRVRVFNPTFQWAWGLKNPAMKNVPTLDSPWVAAGMIRIQPDLNFFIMAGLSESTRPAVSVRVYKYKEGKWYMGDLPRVEIGTAIAGKITDTTGKTTSTLDVDTHYTVVDVVQATGRTENVSVILADPSGVLITRDSGADRSDPSNAELRDTVLKQAAAAAATAPSSTTQPGWRGSSPTP